MLRPLRWGDLKLRPVARRLSRIHGRADAEAERALLIDLCRDHQPSRPVVLPLYPCSVRSCSNLALRLTGNGRSVTQILNLLNERRLLHCLFVEINDGGLTFESNISRLDASRPLQSLFDVRSTRIASHPFNVNFCFQLYSPP